MTGVAVAKGVAILMLVVGLGLLLVTLLSPTSLCSGTCTDKPPPKCRCPNGTPLQGEACGRDARTCASCHRGFVFNASKIECIQDRQPIGQPTMLLEERSIAPPRGIGTTTATLHSTSEDACNNTNYPTKNMCDTASGDCMWTTDGACTKKYMWIGLILILVGVGIIVER